MKASDLANVKVKDKWERINIRGEIAVESRFYWSYVLIRGLSHGLVGGTSGYVNKEGHHQGHHLPRYVAGGPGAGQRATASDVKPAVLEDLDGPREPIIVDMVSEPAPERTTPSSAKVSIKENAVLGDEALQAGLRKMNADFADFCIPASGEAWGKPLIDQKTKVLIVIAVDVVEMIQGKPFENHLYMAVQQGITREEIEELLLFMTIYVGFNKTGSFYGAFDECFRARE